MHASEGESFRILRRGDVHRHRFIGAVVLRDQCVQGQREGTSPPFPTPRLSSLLFLPMVSWSP